MGLTGAPHLQAAQGATCMHPLGLLLLPLLPRACTQTATSPMSTINGCQNSECAHWHIRPPSPLIHPIPARPIQAISPTALHQLSCSRPGSTLSPSSHHHRSSSGSIFNHPCSGFSHCFLHAVGTVGVTHCREPIGGRGAWQLRSPCTIQGDDACKYRKAQQRSRMIL